MNTHETAGLPAVRSNVPSIEGVTFSITPNADAKEIIASLHRCLGGLRKLEDIGKLVLFIAADHLRVIAQRKLFKPKYTSLEGFIQNEILEKYNVSRGSVFNSYLIMSQVPGITPDTASKMKVVNLVAAAKLLRDGVMDKEKGSRKLLEDVNKLSIEEFRQRHPQAVHAGIGKRVIRIATTTEYYNLFWKIVGDKDPMEFILSLVERSKDLQIHRSKANGSAKKHGAVAS